MQRVFSSNCWFSSFGTSLKAKYSKRSANSGSVICKSIFISPCINSAIGKSGRYLRSRNPSHAGRAPHNTCRQILWTPGSLGILWPVRSARPPFRSSNKFSAFFAENARRSRPPNETGRGGFPLFFPNHQKRSTRGRGCIFFQNHSCAAQRVISAGENPAKAPKISWNSSPLRTAPLNPKISCAAKIFSSHS